MIRFIGFVLMVIGGLIGTLCGLCTIFGIFTILTHPSKPQPGFPSALVLFVGGVPTLIGIGLFLLGLAIVLAEEAGSRPTGSQQIERGHE